MAHSFFSIFLIVIVGISPALAQKGIDLGYLGEKNYQNYAGTHWPSFDQDLYYARSHWQDDARRDAYFDRVTWNESSEWQKFLSDELVSASSCPHPVFSESLEQMSYAFRLLSLSYLLEVADGVRNDLVLMKNSSCEFKPEEWLKACNPKSPEMKSFIQNLLAQQVYSPPLVSKEHNFSAFTRQWLEDFEQGKPRISTSRLKLECEKQKNKCTPAVLSELYAMSAKICQEDKKTFQEICSEQDDLYGMASVPLSFYLVSTSNLMNQLNQSGHGAGCLRRFSVMLSHKEQVPYVLRKLTPVIMTSLKDTWKDRYPQGRAFLYGALKEYEAKGLAVFEPKVVPKKVEEPAPVAVAKVKSPEPVKTAPKVVEVPVVVAPPVVVKKTEVPVEVKSAFLTASEIRLLRRLNKVDVDMMKFHYDHVFSLAEMQLLTETLKDFTSRKILQEMKDNDKLGTEAAPVPLTFLKFLIDSENHQGLFNITGILGERFWVTNDVDKKFKTPQEWVQLQYDQNLSNTWQLYILSPED